MTGRRSLFARWLLVCVIALGVVAMHSLLGPTGCAERSGGDRLAATRAAHAGMAVSADPMSHATTVVRQPDGSHPAGCSLLGHLCLAVLAALGLALLAALPRALGATAAALVRPIAWRGATSRPRAPPPTSVRLAELCVSRR